MTTENIIENILQDNNIDSKLNDIVNLIIHTAFALGKDPIEFSRSVIGCFPGGLVIKSDKI